MALFTSTLVGLLLLHRCTGQVDEDGCKPCQLYQYQPVCAGNLYSSEEPKTFASKCHLVFYNCKNSHQQLQIISEGECGSSSSTTTEEPCPSVCPAVFMPVCAKSVNNFSLRTFGNGCEFSAHNCKNPSDQYIFIKDGACEGTEPPAECPSVCAEIYKPVCAASPTNNDVKTTFSNDCYFRKHNCENPLEQLIILYKEECKASPNECERACTLIYLPVCAKLPNSDEKPVSFPNKCVLEVENCKNPYKQLQIIYEGECISTTTETPVCPVFCTEVVMPVCAKPADADFPLITFGNGCKLTSYNCDNPSNQYVFVGNGSCDDATPPPQCPSVCLDVYRPICAARSDDNNIKITFTNECFLKLHNCEEPLNQMVILYDWECESSPNIPACPTVCAAIYAPVCAKVPNSNDKPVTYPSKCVLDIQNCKNPFNRSEILYNGECSGPSTCSAPCSPVAKFVCAGLPYSTLPPKTFTNDCELEKYNCRNQGNPLVVLFEGKCDEPDPYCPEICDNTLDPVCAGNIANKQPPRVFSNLCKLRLYNCLHPYRPFAKLQVLSKGKCPWYPWTPQTKCSRYCHQTLSPVCTGPRLGGETTTFKNKCLADQHNCKFPKNRLVTRYLGVCRKLVI